MKIPVSKAAKTWGVSRNTIYEKHRRGELSMVKGEGVDPSEMSRVFGKPKTTGKTPDTHHKDNAGQPQDAGQTAQILELENMLKLERVKREQAEQRLERAEKQADQLLEQVGNLTETMKLLEAPKSEPKAEKKGFLSRFF